MPTLLSIGYFITFIKETLPISELHDAFNMLYIKEREVLFPLHLGTLLSHTHTPSPPKKNPNLNSALTETEEKGQV